MRRSDHRLVLAGKRALDRHPRRIERRAPVRRADLADAQLARLELFSVNDANAIQRNAARLERAAIANHHRIADRAHLLVQRRLDRDLGTDAARIAGGDGDFGLHCQGMSEAWITSGTPCPPTDLIARSTSFRPKRWVVTFSSAKRFEASCCSASSQAR